MRIRVLALVAVLGLALSACDDSPTGPKPDVNIEILSASEVQLEPGEQDTLQAEVTITGSASATPARWESADSSVATTERIHREVTGHRRLSTAVVTGVSAGQVSVRAEVEGQASHDGMAATLFPSDSIQVTVTKSES